MAAAAETERAAPPCMKCGHAARIEGHRVCAGCHDPEKCGTCHPGYVFPCYESRGVQSNRRGRNTAGAA